MICDHKRKLYLWVPYPESIAGLYNDLDTLQDSCRKAQVPIRGLAISLVETETEGAWVSKDGGNVFECHLTEDQEPLDAPSGLIWDWTDYVKKDISGIGLWEVGSSGTFWRYPDIETLADDMTAVGARKIPYKLAKRVKESCY